MRLTLITLPADPADAVRFPAGSAMTSDRLLRLPLASALAGADQVACTPTASALAVSGSDLPPITVDPALRDRAYGDWAGRRIDAVAHEGPELFARWLVDPNTAPAGVETVAALVARADAWLAGLDDVAGRVVALTHPAVVRAVLAAVLGHLDSWFAFDVGHARRTILTRHGSGWRIAGVNVRLGARV